MPEVEFVFHFNNEFPGTNRFKPIIEKLVKAGKENQNVKIIKGNIDAQSYAAIINSSRIICLLYDPQFYVFKTSGILWDALRCRDIDWLVTAQTWPESELRDLRIPHSTVLYGDIETGVTKIAGLLNHEGRKTAGREYPTADLEYLKLLTSPFGEWLYKEFTSKSFNRHAASVTITNPDYNPSHGRILIVHTHYEQFGSFSGPGGFIPYLRGLGYDVDELSVPLGDEKLKSAPDQLKARFANVVKDCLKSYQGNAVPIEADIQVKMHCYSIIHFLDAEHCGLLSAYYRCDSPLPCTTKLVATYHQPKVILDQIIRDPSYLRGFDRIHLLSPCQMDYFTPFIDPKKIMCRATWSGP